ncbi:hypothetical protein LY90DRAFT_498577 [Neocallimastix californiae]|uniref:Uncharacterized protein n=1 Tax=Neocallimastix californiae TaxID=1754190 RepID=A0A1Y2FUR2_9FUNG|nr:hypothetical protein LY90DRAFT_498577 [Neocallimastix californiae]|eukprot:ORY87307.1 hypothetical protein LY90DRAFT_498577 [Neocallimastix californiae]
MNIEKENNTELFFKELKKNINLSNISKYIGNLLCFMSFENIMKLLIFTICIFLANCTLAKESRVFCRYNYNRLSKVYDLAYFDNEGHIEYAKVLGPTWYGVSWCDNSTMKKRRLEDSNDNKDSNENKDNNENRDNNGSIGENTVTDNPYLRGNDTISDFKKK